MDDFCHFIEECLRKIEKDEMEVDEHDQGNDETSNMVSGLNNVN